MTTFVEVNKIKIVYREQNPNAEKTIFFIHGNSCSSWLWYKQFSDPVFKEYRLIAFDLPGHGNSSALQDPNDYNLLFFAELMAKAASALANSNKFILVGFSFGANVVSEMLNHLRVPAGIVVASPTIVGGTYTLNDTLKKGADPSVLFTDEPEQDAIKAYMHKALLSHEEKDFSMCIRDYNAVRKPFRSMILKTAMEGKLSNEIMNVVNTNLPVLIIFGEQDNFINPDYLDNASINLWNRTIYKIEAAGHFLNLDQPKIVNGLLANYFQEMFK